MPEDWSPALPQDLLSFAVIPPIGVAGDVGDLLVFAVGGHDGSPFIRSASIASAIL